MAIEQQTKPVSRGESLGAEWERARSEIGYLGSAVGRITDELRVLMVREGELAQAEVADSAAAARAAGIWGGAAAVIGLSVVVFLGLAVMFGLATVLAMWAAALITALILAGVAGVFGMLALGHIRKFSLVPKRTMQSVREDVKWARDQMKRHSA